MTPGGARELYDLRLTGKRPMGFIVVTDDYEIAKHFRNPLRSMCALTFQRGKAYDWKVLHGLDVALITPGNRDGMTQICAEILKVEPKSFSATYHSDMEPRDVIIPLC